MPLSEKTTSGLLLQRNDAWIAYHNCDSNNKPHVRSSIEDWQWFVRDREQTALNVERKKQWATKLRFIRPDVKKSVADQLNEIVRKQFVKQWGTRHAG